MYISSYCTTGFIEEVTKQSIMKFHNPENVTSGKSYFELLDLLSNGLNIITDSTHEKLIEKSENPYIKFLIKNNRISCDAKSFERLKLNDKTFFSSKNNPICLYLLSGFHEDTLKDYQKKTGYNFCSSSSSSIDLFADRIQNFNTNENMSFDFTNDFFTPHYSIVIADPYLFSEHNKNAIELLLKKIMPRNLEGNYHITLVGSDINRYSNLNKSDVIEKWVDNLSKKLNKEQSTVLDFCIFNESEFHDRIIITNNTLIISGVGLSMIRMEKSFGDSIITSSKDTIWIGFKIYKRILTNKNNSILVYNLMLEKLSILKGWISRSKQKSSPNPLFKV